MATSETPLAARTWMDRIADSPITWTILGVALGLGLGVNSIAPWLIVLGLAAWGGNMLRRDPAHPAEDERVLGGPAFLLAWTIGFVIRGVSGLD